MDTYILLTLLFSLVSGFCQRDNDCYVADHCVITYCDAGECITRNKTCSSIDQCVLPGCMPDFGCTSERKVCDDGNQCTRDRCDPENGCVYTPAVCTAPNTCTFTECDPAVGCSSTTVTCDDENPCTEDKCEEGLGCTHKSLSCSDHPICVSLPSCKGNDTQEMAVLISIIAIITTLSVGIPVYVFRKYIFTCLRRPVRT